MSLRSDRRHKSFRITTIHQDHQLVSVLRAGDAEPCGDNAWGAVALAYRSPDRSRAAGIWAFGPGEFEYMPNHEELLFITAGSVTVTPDNGEPIALSKGDAAYLPAHQRAHWVATAVVRAAFCSVAIDTELDY